VENSQPAAAPLRVLPTLWFRNTWSWERDDPDPGGLRSTERSFLRQVAPGLAHAEHRVLDDYWLACDRVPELLFIDNETNTARLWGGQNRTPYVKDGINEAVVGARADAVNPAHVGTKAAAHYAMTIAPGATETIVLRLSDRLYADRTVHSATGPRDLAMGVVPRVSFARQWHWLAARCNDTHRRHRGTRVR
jgi:hypothetical protein